MNKPGIATKLYLAFGSIFLLSAVSVVVGWQGFQRISDSQNSVIDQAIPDLRRAHSLSELNASIGAAAQQLVRASDETERQAISAVLFAHVEALNTLLNESRQEPFLQTLRDTVQEITGKLHQQNEQVRQRNQQHKHFTGLSAKLVAATAELNELADSLVANAAATTTAITSNLYDLVENNASQQALYQVFDRLVEVDIDAMERMYELRLRSANLRGLFNRVGKESDITVLGTLRQRTAETLTILKRRVSEINDPQRREKANQLLNAMEVDNGPLYVYGIFETRVSLLEINQSLTRLALETGEASQRLNGIVKQLNTAGGTLINRVSTTAKQSLDTSRSLFNWISAFSLLVAAVILWGFVKRNVIRRLLLLESATRNIAAGNYAVEIIDEGRDELANMGQALRGFRNNAIEKRRVDEELQRHKAHLEELVGERTEQLRKTNEKLSEAVQNHAIAREKAEQANQAKTTFLATVSHELRTPLSGALGSVRLLADTPLQAQQLDYLRTIDTANTTLLDIVNDILGYSQLEAGKLKIDAREFQLTVLLNNVVDLMRVPVSENGNKLALHIDAALPQQWLGDAGKLHQVLLNLIGNANKFTEKGAIALRVCAGDSDVVNAIDALALRFVVEDTGIGIGADKHTEIFQAFTQVDTSSARQYGGIGLGLAICDRLVAAMGGSMHLESQLGGGTRIGFDVPLQPCSLQPDTERSGTGRPGSKRPGIDIEAFSDTPGHHKAGIDVLMVEDDDANRMVTNNYLQKLGHRVIAAQTGEQALSLLDSAPLGPAYPSLVLLDISLPGIDGLTILRRLRTHTDKVLASTPVIAMSAHVFTEEVDQYLSAGMNGFLGKPFSMEDLDSAIRAVNRNGCTNSLVGTQANSQANIQVNAQIQAENAPIFDASVIDEDIHKLGLERVEAMLDVFHRSGGAQYAVLLKAIELQVPVTIEKAAHKLRGAAGNFGLQQLCALLTTIEAQAKRQVSIPDVHCQQLQDNYTQAVAALKAHIAKYKPKFRS